MTHEEFIGKALENRKRVKELTQEIVSLQNEEKQLLTEYTREHRKFQDGQKVHYTQEKYKVPRTYYITSVFSYVEHNNDGSYECKILYHIATANGHQPNGGWLIDEKDLVIAE